MSIKSNPEAPILFSTADWQVRPMRLTWEKVTILWHELNKYPSMFSDVVIGDVENFIRALAAPDSLWFEVWSDDEIVGLVWLTEFNGVNGVVHCSYFDRDLSSKREVTRRLIEWGFAEYRSLHRLTAMPPVFYHATTRLLESIGFTQEGTLRESVIIRGKWRDQVIYGIIRHEAEAQWDSPAKQNSSLASAQT